ncbi:exodeoxyribonuclease III [Sediminivirga luteola]|uniref:exodeoxyribonuclease III n=1 Tax=Sediminivirga luteola TaxID=1774748 RepID=UPI001F58206E|nr:exodeoxyribonuclease III [Sediminivirga luteola]
MRIATWNVNSIRARAERVGGFLDRSDVDVLAIQELKCKDEQFPREVFESRGYEVAFHGLNQWNGVAIASRVGLEDVQLGFENVPGFGDEPAVEARAISALTGGVKVYSLYVPNGRELDHPHYTYKLEWLENLRLDARQQLDAEPEARIALCGDFNIAPEDEDVWDMAEFEGATHVSAPERDAFARLEEAGFRDVTRRFTPGPGVYTFWDYQNLSFPKKKGMRIDFVLGSPALQRAVSGARIDREERKGKGASDHAPVIADFDL